MRREQHGVFHSVLFPKQRGAGLGKSNIFSRVLPLIAPSPLRLYFGDRTLAQLGLPARNSGC